MSDKKSKKRIKLLSKYNGYWRFDGFGEISSSSSKRLQIDCLFTQIEKQYIEDSLDYPELITKQIKLKFATGWVQRFTVGSVWSDGELVHDNVSISGSYLIDTGKVEACHNITKKDRSTSSQSVYLPETVHNFEAHSSIVDSNCFWLVEVKNRTNHFLLIPATEIFRYYYATSDQLARNLIAPGFFSIIDTYKSSPTGIYSELSDLHSMEKYVLAWGMSTAFSRAAIAYPHKRLQKFQYMHKPRVLIGKFPFEGLTNLTVSGKNFTLSDEGVTKSITYVTKILHCDFDPGLEDVVFFQVKSSSPETGNNEPFGNAPISNPDYISLEKADNDEASDNDYSTLSIPVLDDRFPGMKNWKGITRTAYVSGEGSKNYLDEPDGYSFEDGTNDENSSKNRRISNYGNNIALSGHDLRVFMIMLKILFMKMNTNVGFSCEAKTRCLNGSAIVSGHFVTAFPVLDNKEASRWSEVRRTVDGKDITDSRNLVWAQFTHNRKTIDLLEMESVYKNHSDGKSSMLLARQDFARIQNKEITEYLERVNLQKGWPSVNNQVWSKEEKVELSEYLKTYKSKRLSHPPHPEFLEAREALYSSKITLDYCEKWANYLEAAIIKFFE